MSGTRAAIRYAKAILDIASENKSLDAVNQDMILIGSTIRSNKELNDLVVNPTVSVLDKNQALQEIFKQSNPITQQLFRLLADNNRFGILEAITEQYNMLFNEVNGIELAQVTTAFPMTPELEKKVLAKITAFSNKKVIITNVVDESIIGGFILRIKDQQYNASIAQKLHKLSRELSN